MIMRNGIRSALRARGRTVLFTALILLLTVLLALGLGIWAYCSQTLAQMDESYTSIALVEYMGENYPEKDKADSGAQEAAKELAKQDIGRLAGVRLWETPEQTLAAMEGYERALGTIPYEDYGVIQVSDLKPLYEEGYQWTTDISLLPEDCIVINTVTEERTYYAAGLEPIFVPRYTKIDDEYFQYELKNGEAVLSPILPEDFPEHYVLIDGTLWTYEGIFPEEYNRDEMTNTICYYDPAEDKYGIPGQVLSGYFGYVDAILYAKGQREHILVIVDPGDQEFTPEQESSYLLHGRFVKSTTSYQTFRMEEFLEDAQTPPYLEVSGEDDPALAQSIFADYAAYYNKANNYIRVEASDAVEALECFQQRQIYLEQGRFSDAGETGVCVADGWTARTLGLSLGDSVNIDLLSSSTGNRFDLSQKGETQPLKIIGITNPSEDYAGSLWVSAAQGNFENPLFGYVIGRAVLDNSLSLQAAEALQELAPDNVRVTLYDQGYSAAAKPLQAMKFAAMSVTAGCICGVLAVLFLFAYLFVGRQKENVVVLVSFGTPAGKIWRWLLSGAAVIAGIAAFLGAVLGGLFLNMVLKAALDLVQVLYAADQRYSEAAVGIINEPMNGGAVPVWPAAVAGGCVFFIALVLCLFFARQACQKSVPKRGKTYTRAPKGGAFAIGEGAVRFAFLSAMRGGWRSYVVPVAAFVLTLLLGFLASGFQGFGRQIDVLYDTAKISGQVTSVNGRQSTDLSVSAPNARLLWSSGMLDDISVSLSWNYWLANKIPFFGAEASDSRDSWIAGQPEIVALNDLLAAPAFYYGGLSDVQWLDGWDESFLKDTEKYYSIVESIIFDGEGSGIMIGGKEALTYPCLISQSFMEEEEVLLGDTFDVNILLKDIQGGNKEMTVSLLAVGAYTGSESQQEIYAPLSFWCNPSWIMGGELPLAEGERPKLVFYDEKDRDGYYYANTTFTTCRFTLTSAGDLDDFRDYLERQGVSQVGKLSSNRMTVVLMDESFAETLGGLNRYVLFGRILLPALYAAVGLLGFVISWLMIHGRRMEFAIMRGLGASRGRTFASFFMEQAGLALTGGLLGGLLLMALKAGESGWLAAAGFFGCYLAGTALAVLSVQRIKLLRILSERE